ncbi:HNH endonuclease [candidate division KSB1 bacterium]
MMVYNKVLVLNQNYEPLGICNVQRAIILLYLGKAEVVDRIQNQYMRSMKLQYPVPTIVRLYLYRKIPRKKVVLSRKNILIRDNYQCQYCGRRHVELTVDHVIPRDRRGTEVWENLVCACVKCNHKKGNRTPEEAGMPLLSKPRSPSFIAFFRYFAGTIYETWKPYLFMN